jgi:hypothetical protein
MLLLSDNVQILCTEITCSGGTKDLVVSVVDILSADWQHLTNCGGRRFQGHTACE